MSDKPKIYLRTTLSQEDPNELTTKVTIQITRTENIDKDVIVVKYTPINGSNIYQSYDYHHIAYLDELQRLPVTVPDVKRPCYVRRDTVVYYSENEETAQAWCSSVYKEIQRLLLSAYAGLDVKKDMLVTVETDNIEEEPYPSSSSSCSSSSSDSSSYSSSSSASDEIELTYDGEPL